MMQGSRNTNCYRNNLEWEIHFKQTNNGEK